MMGLGMILFLGSSAIGSAQDSFKIGVNENVGPTGAGKGNSEQLHEMYRSLGLNSVRTGILWDQLERQKGQLVIDRSLAGMDNFLLQARSKGIEPLVGLGYGNKLYDAGAFPKSPEAQDGFIRYATFMANRYKGSVKYYEIWNEYDIGMGIPGNPPADAALYTTLLQKVYAALKAIDPEIVVMGGATSGVDVGFVTQMLEAGALKTMDAVSVHPYVYPYGPEKALPWFDKLQSEAARYTGGRALPVYATEIGWPDSKGPKGTDQPVVADYLARTLLLFPTRSFVKGVWWYDRIDDGLDPNKGNHHLGLFRHDHSPKPVTCALSEVSKLLSSHKAISAQQQGKQIWVAKYSGADGFLFAVWSEGRDFQPSVTIEAGPNVKITARGIFGTLPLRETAPHH